MRAIYKRELRSYFQSMTGCVFVAFLVIFTGIYFTAYNLNMGYPYFSYTLSGSLIVFLVGIPLITMKSFSEERKNKTDQLLLTAPVSVGKIIIGKYLALITVFLIPVGIICCYPLIMGKYGVVSYPMAYTAILGFVLLGAAQIAVGVFLSSLTENPVIAAVMTFIALFVCYMITGISSLIPDTSASSLGIYILLVAILTFFIYHMIQNLWIAGGIGIVGEASLLITYLLKPTLFESGIQKFLEIFDITSHFDDFTNGIFDLNGIVYFLSVIVIFMFLSVQTITKRRWN